MIKLVIFDLDGVLVDARELHFDALNRALATVGNNYVISREEHLLHYDGLPTADKLRRLTLTKGLPQEAHKSVWAAKQEMTRFLIDKFSYDEQKRDLLKRLKKDGLSIACASNSVRDTVRLLLLRTGLLEYVDFCYSNEDVRHPKPHAEIYLRCMLAAGCDPTETLIVEDSPVGRLAAARSGAYVCAVRHPADVIYSRLKKEIVAVVTHDTPLKWQSDNLNILIPMAGSGSRFRQAGYTFPKPLVEVRGKPMIQVVVENLNIEARYIFIVREEHYDTYNLRHLLQLIAPGCEIITVKSLTEGAACTTLLARRFIDNDCPLLLANSDQFVDWDSSQFMWDMVGDHIDGGILTFENTHPKWSYVRLDDNGLVTEVAEKQVISNQATVGIYYWKKGSDYVRYADQMIAKNVRVNGEFYVCPVFNEAIADGKKIKACRANEMWGLGTPEDLSYFLNHYTGHNYGR
jgi:HAD superfamily hydrolase (TIGR01509 family)